MRLAPLMFVAILVVACGRKGASPEPEPNLPTAEVAAADAFGASGEMVSDVAFWSHPSVAFESLLLSAGEAGLRADRIETGDAIFEIPGRSDAIEVVYAGVGPSATGYLLVSGDGAMRLFRIHQDGAGFDPVALANAAFSASAFCAGGGAAPKVYEIDAGKLSVRALTIVADGAELGAARAIAAAEGATACHVDPLTQAVILVSRDGAIRRVDPANGASFGIALPDRLAPVSSALAIGRDETGAPVIQVALLDGPSATISLFDASDGHALGAVRIKATFDLGAVVTASRIAIGAANYGGVYRDGALAVVTSGDGAPVRLVPWNGVMGALSLAVPAVPDPRAPAGDAPEADVISIDVIEP